MIQRYINIITVIVAIGSMAFSIYSRSMDNNTEFLEKESKYREETSIKINNLKEVFRTEIQSIKNDINYIKLDNQKSFSDVNQSLLLNTQRIEHLKNQYEHIQSITESKINSLDLKMEKAEDRIMECVNEL